MSPLFVRNNVIAAEQLGQIGDVGIHTGLGYKNRLAAALKPGIKLTAKRRARVSERSYKEPFVYLVHTTIRHLQ